MKKFRVGAKSVSFYHIDVEAEDETEAILKAKDADAEEFESDDDGYFDLIDGEVQELKEE